jgi:5-methylcytosine-specific restriction endonuclease McrA
MPTKGANAFWRGLEDERFLTLKGYDKIRHFRFRIWEIHNGLCSICGHPVEFAKAEIDHVVPSSLGGEDHYTNLRPAHIRCNRSKGNLGNNHYYSTKYTPAEIAKRKALGDFLKTEARKKAEEGEGEE